MKITAEWLQKRDACLTGIDWFVAQNEPAADGLQIVKKLISENKLDWANWLIVRIMKYKQYVAYAVFAAENVIDIYEEQYPGDNRPRNAIEAAKKCITNPSAENKMAARAAARAAGDAARAAWAAAGDAAGDAARAAARAARDAAWAAAWAARAAAGAAARAAAGAAAGDAAWAAWAAAGDAARAAMKTKILKYGITLLEEK